MGGEGEFLVLGLGCLETEYRHLVSKPDRYLLARVAFEKISTELFCGVMGKHSLITLPQRSLESKTAACDINGTLCFPTTF